MKKQQENMMADENLLMMPKLKADICNKNRVAIFFENWVEVLTRHGTTSKHMQSFRKGTLIFRDEDIDRIVKSGAPVRVFVEEVVSVEKAEGVVVADALEPKEVDAEEDANRPPKK